MRSTNAMLALVTDAFGGRGGIAQYNRDFLGALAESGGISSITLLPRLAPDQFVLPERIEQKRARFNRMSYSLAAVLTALFRPVCIVFCGHLYMAPLAALIKRLKRAKLIVQTHGIEAWPQPTKHQRAAVEAADLVLCVSRYTRAAVLSWAAIEPERVLVLPDTVNEAFTPGEGDLMRARLGLDNKHVLLSVGRLDSRERYKGHDRVIAAIPELLENGYDIHYLIVGEGDDRKRLEALADGVKARGRVHFLGNLGLSDLVEAYRAADLFVLPSTREGFGIVFLEAMASGTAALGFGVAGAKDALADGELGTVASEGELAQTIGSLFDQKRLGPEELAAAVRARFGRDTFVTAANAALNRLSEACAGNPGAY